jgi:DUF4097 and DUF4098 domain-containing protein YvlB
MIGTLAALTLAVMATHTDTTIAVKAGTRLELGNFGGSIAVSTWSKNAVRVVAEHSSRVEIRIESSGSTLGIEAQHSRGFPSTVDYQLTVPRGMALDLSGVSTDVSVENSEGEVKIESVQGEVSVTGGTKSVSASSVEGEVHVRGASGRVTCSSVNGGVHIEKTTGPVAASSVNGEIVLDGVDSKEVDASTINGTVRYDGVIKDGGSYRFSTHNGDVSVAVPEQADATISVATFSGDFSSEFKIQLQETRHGKRFNFTLGNGGARIELESFQGSIRLRRPGSPETKRAEAYRYEYKKSKETVKDKHKNSGHEENEP